MKILTIAQIVISILLIASILLQQREGGLSATFGGQGGFYRTRRGAEKIILWATIMLALLFFVAALANIILQK